jgi:hypothetical protein
MTKRLSSEAMFHMTVSRRIENPPGLEEPFDLGLVLLVYTLMKSIREGMNNYAVSNTCPLDTAV